MNNLVRLLNSIPGPDSDLSGVDLVANQPYKDDTTQAAVDTWPKDVPIVFNGFEIGSLIGSGGPMVTGLADNNPLKHAYEVVAMGAGGRAGI